ncbi:unnamed protein product, partial [Sphacelaria rigidula]
VQHCSSSSPPRCQQSTSHFVSLRRGAPSASNAAVVEQGQRHSSSSPSPPRLSPSRCMDLENDNTMGIVGNVLQMWAGVAPGGVVGPFGGPPAGRCANDG